MNTTSISLPITETLEPTTQEELLSLVNQARESLTPIYPIGGGTSLDYGLPATKEGVGISLAKLNRVIDYPAADMTITVEPGVTFQELSETLSAHNQRLPLDIPLPQQATLGGITATNWSGSRRYSLGTMRDSIIGISAIDGLGTLFKAGGRVVKNVAGYDFCKLLTGSLGTLGIFSQMTLRLRPQPQNSAFLLTKTNNFESADRLLGELVHANVSPAAIDLLAGGRWHENSLLKNLTDELTPTEAILAVGFEGTQTEVQWMLEELRKLWKNLGQQSIESLTENQAEQLWQYLAEFPAVDNAPLTIKASLVPSATTQFIQALLEIDPHCKIQAYAGNGIILAQFSEFPQDGLSQTVVARLLPLASRAHGNVIVLSNPGNIEMTHQSVWGGIGVPFDLMTDIKKQFDPDNLLNPGRFIYL